MPLVVMCGYPSSGKSTRVKELLTFIDNGTKEEAHIVHVDSFITDKNLVYSDSHGKEKELHANLKSATSRYISKDNLVINDSLNYIKSIRYELDCIALHCQTPRCTIWCDVEVNQCREWNSTRSHESDRYSSEVFETLVMRFEAPIERNRWDRPLYVIRPQDALPCQDIYDALYKRKAPPPHASTLSQPLAATNFLHDLDQMTKTVIMKILELQQLSVPGDELIIPGANSKLCLKKQLTLAELQNKRRQFINITKSRSTPLDTVSHVTNMFVQYLNTSQL